MVEYNQWKQIPFFRWRMHHRPTYWLECVHALCIVQNAYVMVDILGAAASLV